MVIDPITALTLASTASSLLGGAGAAGGGTGSGGGGLFSFLGGGGAGGPFGGIASGISSLISGPGRGETRRASARSLVASSPELTRLQGVMRGRNLSAEGVLQTLRAYLPEDAGAARALAAILAEGQQLGGFGKAQGERGNMLGDLLKWVLLGETVTQRPLPSLGQLIALFTGRTPAPAPPPQSPSDGSPDPLYSAQPVGSPVVLTPATLAAREASMGSVLDSINTGLQVAGQVLGNFSGGSMPGGAPIAQPFGGLPSLSFDAPLVDVTPQGSSVLLEPFAITPSGARAKAFVAINPASARPEWFTPAGRPILWSRDLAVVRRVKKLASRTASLTGARRVMPRRRSRGR